jgi:hypothetical protein
MRYPNLRYGNPAELEYYAMTFGDDKTRVKNLARFLKRDERTVQRWLDGKQRVPWWVPELLRLNAREKFEQARQMGFHKRYESLCVVTHQGQLELRRRTDKKPPALTDLRLDDFDRPTRAV